MKSFGATPWKSAVFRTGGISHYIEWLKERVEEMYRLLKPAGSIFLHCDWYANI